jgi:hypothetical protein
MKGKWTRKLPGLLLMLFIAVVWGVVAQDNPPVSSAVTAPSSPDTTISWRETIFVLFVLLILFAGLIGYEWVRKRT